MMIRFERTYSDAPDEIVEAGLVDLWQRLDGYHWISPMAEHIIRGDLIRATKSGLNAEAVRRSADAMVARNPASMGAVPGVARRLQQEQERVLAACRALIQQSAGNDELSEVGRVRRLAEVRWTYMAALADLDTKTAAAMAAARQRAAAPMAAVDRHGERFQAAVSELSMYLSAQNTEAIAAAWRRAVERRNRTELEAWAGVSSILRGWRGFVPPPRTIAETDGNGAITTRMAIGSEQLANQIEAEWQTIIEEMLTPAEREAGEYRRAVEREEIELEAAYIARPGLMDLVS